MKNFVVIANVFKDKNLVLSQKIISYIEAKGGKGTALTCNNSDDTSKDFCLEDIPEDTDLILVLGGDGTMIRTATKVVSLEIPIMGVDLGTLGFLCEVEASNVFRAIDSLMEQKYMIENRILLTGHKIGEKEKKVAFNDIVIHRAGDLQMLTLNVFVNGEFLTTYHADGLIVATPSGSTGYNMSAGGPIVDPKGDMLLLTPNNAHNLNSKSIVLSGEDTIEIEVGSRRSQMDEKACVSFDGDPVSELLVGDRFIISKAKNHSSICKLHRRSFLEILSKKMEIYS